MSTNIGRWRAEIQAHALEDPPFKNLQEADLKTDWARFYWYPNRESAVALIKVFTGGTAGILYRQEIAALYGLRSTRRVCTVLCDSTRHLPSFWDEDFLGPYFIAKLYYPKSLSSALRATTGLEKLDLAAQEIVIAHLFLRLGWRDYDWRKENDVIDNGKLLRVDLDSASALSAMFEEKSTVGDQRFFSTAERDTLQGFLRLREQILRSSESNEVRNLAIRLSHMVFIEENDENKLTTLINEIQSNGLPEHSSTSAGTTSQDGRPSTGAASHGRIGEYARRAGALLTRGVATVLKSQGANGSDSRRRSQTQDPGPVATQGADSGVVIELLDDWVDLWLRQAPSKTTTQPTTPQSLSQLSHDEWGLLARLFHHLIRNPDHGFTLADFHMSILMLIVAFLRDRKQRLAAIGKPESELIKVLAPNTGFFEVKNVFAITGPEQAQGQAESVSLPRRKRPQPATAKTSGLKIEFSSDSGYWGAPTKGLGREGEDRALVLSGRHVLVAAVTDGVSEASGLEAATIVERAVREWSEQLDVNSPEEAAGEMRNVFRKVNTSLVAAYKETKRPHQAMLVIAVVRRKEDSCFVSIAQSGDSDCVVFSPDGSLRFSTKSWDTVRLGTSETLKDEDVRVEHISFALGGVTGSYRVRLFSDGIGERGYERLRDVAGISDLIQEAAHWPESLGGAVGHDDWSVAGLDISINEAVAQAVDPFPDDVEQAWERFENAPPEQAPLLDAIYKLEAGKFRLSEPAKDFWGEALTTARDDNNSAGFKFISGIVEPSRAVKPPPITKPIEPREPAHGDSIKESRFAEWKSAIIAIGIVALIGLGVIVWSLWRSSSSTRENLTEETKEKPTPTPTEATEPDLSFSTPEQRKIYSDLKERRFYVSDGLPGGEGITNQPIKTFLSGLSQVLIHSKYKVAIEVFASPGGDSKANLGMSDRRAQSIRRSLINDYKVPDNLVTDAVGKGFWEGNSVGLDTETLRQVNTKGAIIIVRRR
jgi:hypothetical protein